MKLRVLRLYDDAWGTAVIASGGNGSENGKQGAFPIVSHRPSCRASYSSYSSPLLFLPILQPLLPDFTLFTAPYSGGLNDTRVGRTLL